MSTTPTPTYYAPSTTGDIVTTWLPLTTTYPSHGDCASNFWAFQDEIWAWVPDSPAHSWTAQCLPPVATLSYLVSQSFLSAAQDAYNIGPFIGCPNWFKAVTTLTVSETGSLTICCPTSYGLLISGTTTGCTSTAFQTVINIMHGTSSTGTLTVSSTAAAVTAYSSWIAQMTISAGQVVVAHPILSYNFPSSKPGDSGSAPISTGVIAGLAILSVWAVGGTIAAIVLTVLFRRARKSSRTRDKSPKYAAAPGYTQLPPAVKDQSDPPVSVGPLFDITEGREQRVELPVGDVRTASRA